MPSALTCTYATSLAQTRYIERTEKRTLRESLRYLLRSDCLISPRIDTFYLLFFFPLCILLCYIEGGVKICLWCAKNSGLRPKTNYVDDTDFEVFELSCVQGVHMLAPILFYFFLAIFCWMWYVDTILCWWCCVTNYL